MRWIEATITTKSEEIDELCGRLEMLGVTGMTIEDEADFNKFLENNKQYWDYVDESLQEQYSGKSAIKFYVADDEEGRGQLESIKGALSMEISEKYVADEDWENNWRQYYEPIEIGEKLLVVPEWLEPELNGRTALRLDPGLIFGTGSHETTRMCLEAIQEYEVENKRVLDLGCGSGILGIGAMVLGAKEVIGCDVDPKAPDVAEGNAALNGISAERFKVYAGDLLTDEGVRKMLGTDWDMVLANIVSDVIIPLSDFVRRFMKPGAKFICSGIIDGREEEVEEHLKSNGFNILEHKHEGEWHCFMTE